MSLKRSIVAVASVFTVFTYGTASAQLYDYNVDFTITENVPNPPPGAVPNGTTDTITGTIVTNCDSCSLFVSGNPTQHLVSWSFTDSNGTSLSSSEVDETITETGNSAPLSVTPTAVIYTPGDTLTAPNGGYANFDTALRNGPAVFYFWGAFNGNFGNTTGNLIQDSTIDYIPPDTPLTIGTVAAVPEPSTLWLVLAGLIPLGSIHWRRWMKLDRTASLELIPDASGPRVIASS
jgi:hypothetical protein